MIGFHNEDLAVKNGGGRRRAGEGEGEGEEKGAMVANEGNQPSK